MDAFLRQLLPWWVLLTVLGAWAAPPTTSQDPHPSWGLRLGIREDFTLSAFDGSSLALTREFGPRHRMLVGLELAGDYGTAGEDPIRTLEENRRLLWMFEWTGPPGRGPRSVWALGATGSYSDTGRGLLAEQSFSLGLRGCAGVEWRITPALTLLASYSLAVQRDRVTVRRHATLPDEREIRSTSKTRTLSLQPGQVSFALGVRLPVVRLGN
jgi:hypothetical protein